MLQKRVRTAVGRLPSSASFFLFGKSSQGEEQLRLTCSDTMKTLFRGKPLASLLYLLIACACLTDAGWGANSQDSRPRSADPWFTGTLLSTRGRTLDPGHLVIQPYVFYTRYGGLYNDNWRLHSATASRTIIRQTFFIYGLRITTYGSTLRLPARYRPVDVV